MVIENAIMESDINEQISAIITQGETVIGTCWEKQVTQATVSSETVANLIPNDHTHHTHWKVPSDVIEVLICSIHQTGRHWLLNSAASWWLMQFEISRC